MLAEVEKPGDSWPGTFVLMEMGDPVCGEDFCDGCGDCLACQYHDDVDWCNAGSTPRWVIYGNDPKNLFLVAV